MKNEINWVTKRSSTMTEFLFLVLACLMALICGIGMGIDAKDSSIVKDCDTMHQFRINDTAYGCGQVVKNNAQVDSNPKIVLKRVNHG